MGPRTRTSLRLAASSSPSLVLKKEARLSPGFFASSPLLRAQPEAEGDRHHSRQTEPGDGILQMVVPQTDMERAGLYAGDQLRRFQIDIERRNGLAIAIPAEGARHGQMVAREPQSLLNAGVGRQQARALGKPDVARELRRRNS